MKLYEINPNRHHKKEKVHQILNLNTVYHFRSLVSTREKNQMIPANTQTLSARYSKLYPQTRGEALGTS